MRYHVRSLHECQGDVFKERVINAANFMSRKIGRKELPHWLFEMSVEEGRNRLFISQWWQLLWTGPQQVDGLGQSCPSARAVLKQWWQKDKKHFWSSLLDTSKLKDPKALISLWISCQGSCNFCKTFTNFHDKAQLHLIFPCSFSVWDLMCQVLMTGLSSSAWSLRSQRGKRYCRGGAAAGELSPSTHQPKDVS